MRARSKTGEHRAGPPTTELWEDLAAPPPPGLPAIGPAILDGLAGALQMDDHWTVRGELSLTWWGAAVPVQFLVSPPRVCHGDATVKLSAMTAVIHEVTADEADVLTVLSRENELSTTHALVWIASQRRIVSTLTHYAYAGNEADTTLFTGLALVAYTDAVAAGPRLAEELGGRLAVQGHPVNGNRTDTDELLTFSETTVIPRGQAAYEWPAAELEQLPEVLAGVAVAATGGSGQLTAEFAMTELSDRSAASGDTALFELYRDLAHPVYGPGLLGVLRLPTRPAARSVLWTANELNVSEMQAATGFPAWGAWCVDHDETTVTHTVFLPAFFARPGPITALAGFAASRARWADLVLHSTR